MDGDNQTDLNGYQSRLSFDDCLTDITERFTSACGLALRPGDLCCNSWFTLQHAMSAIEIMDPKMDIRVVGSRRIMCTAEQLAAGALPLGPFEDVAELIGIMDELLACVVNWLTGDSLAQSVFISMYMHCTQLLRDPYLAIFCELLRQTVTRLRHFIVSTGSFDEEDHYASTLGMPLYEPSPTFNRFLDIQQDPIVTQHLTDFQRLTFADDLAANLPDLDSSDDPKPLACLRVRLCFIRKFVDFTMHLPIYAHATENVESKDPEANRCLSSVDCSEPHSRDTNAMPYTAVPLLGMERFWFDLDSSCANYQTSLKSLNQTAAVLVTTVGVGKECGRGRIQPKDHVYGLPGFEPFLNQTHLPSYIPRFVVIHERPAAFTYLLKLTAHLLHLLDSIRCIVRLQSHDEHLSTPHPIWALFRAQGQNSCTYLTELLHGSSSSSPSSTTPPVNFNSCVLSRSICYSLYSVSLHRTSQSGEPLSLQAAFVLNAWMAAEPDYCRLPIRSTILQMTPIVDFLDLVGEHLAQIPRLYCLNRSRQRSVLIQWLEKMPELMHECMCMQLMVSVELAKKFDWANVQSSVPLPDGSFKHMDRQLVPIVCYYYYHLSWDYIISGFQLELYSCHEWVLMYTFMIQLLQQLSALMERIATSSVTTLNPECRGNVHNSTESGRQTNHCALLDGEAREPHGNDAAYQPGKNRRKHRKGRSKRNPVPTSSVGVNSHNAAEPPSDLQTPSFSWDKFCGPLSGIELLLLTVHRFLIVGTMYALRALQLDSGGDPVLDADVPEPSIGFANAVEIYGRRLGLFLLVPNSPLMSPSGVRGSFSACRQYVTTGIFSGPTTILYEQAALNYDNARFRIHLVSTRFHHELDAMVVASKIEKTPFLEDIMQQLFGTPDRFSQLDRLANHNSVACRVLAKCPERRPQSTSQDKSSHKAPQKCSFPSQYSPVTLNFNFLPSRAYPLIRLSSVCSHPTPVTE